jgi:hypothetical protein
MAWNAFVSLNVRKGATPEQVENAYEKRRMECCADAGGAGTSFAELQAMRCEGEEFSNWSKQA